MAAQDALKAKGVDEVIVYCVNDCAVMKAWAVDQKVAGSIVTFAADKASVLTKALDVVLDHPGPVDALGNNRCKRFALVVENGIVTAAHVSETAEDPTGDGDISASAVEGILAVL